MNDDDDDNDDIDDDNDVVIDVATENEDSSNLMVDAPESRSSLNLANMQGQDPRPKMADETDDGSKFKVDAVAAV